MFKRNHHFQNMRLSTLQNNTNADGDSLQLLTSSLDVSEGKNQDCSAASGHHTSYVTLENSTGELNRSVVSNNEANYTVEDSIFNRDTFTTDQVLLETVNKSVGLLTTGNFRTYVSADSIDTSKEHDLRYVGELADTTLGSGTQSDHSLTLKIELVVTLLGNIYQSQGRVNMSRWYCRSVKYYVLRGWLATENHRPNWLYQH